MSNVIAFPGPRTRQSPTESSRELHLFLPSDGTFCATLLLEGLDDPQAAFAKAAILVSAMPRGRARDLAEAELECLRQLVGAS